MPPPTLNAVRPAPVTFRPRSEVLVLRRSPLVALVTVLLLTPGIAAAQARPAARSADPSAARIQQALQGLRVRNVGPANMMGRLTDVEGVPGDPRTVYLGAAAGGIFKTTNAGTTWTPVFDDQPYLSIGDLALEPGNPNVIYAGTGESNVRNSVSFGRGVYKSTDGGRTWAFLGLGDTRHIARVLVSPRDVRTVYVCAVGHIGGPNAERGVFRSTDGGATWSKVLFVDDRHGCSDLDIDPVNPNVLYAGMWHFDRKQWTHTSGSTQGGIFKSVDGGTTWRKVTQGLPALIGRIGVKVAASNPNVVYTLSETQDGYLFRSDDQGESWRMVNKEARILCRGFYYSDLRVDPTNENVVWAIACQLSKSIDGGRTFTTTAQGVHGDHHSVWIDPLDPRRVWNGNDGGVAVTYDGGATWEAPANFVASQFYQLHADDRAPFYWISGGLQDNGNWAGPSRTREPSGILNDDWAKVSDGDGYYSVAHPDDPDIFLTDQQGGWILRTNLRTREQQDISPQPKRNDGGPVGDLQYRFNWNAPIVPSPHDGKVVYFGGQVLFRSPDFGTTWQVISPDLTKNQKDRQGFAGGPVLREATTAEYYNTIYAIAESPVQKGVIWVGTDDGNLQVTQDDGKTWTRVDPNVPGVGAEAVVSHVEASRTGACTAYATFERHFMDDYKPYVYKTTDCGRTWANLTGDLPDGAYLQVLREDPRNPQLLYAGTELGLWASWTGGGTWHKVALDGFAHAPVHEVLVHRRENDLIIATHGRGVYILDDATPLQQLGAALGTPASLFEPRHAWRVASRGQKANLAAKVWRGENPPPGAALSYWLAAPVPAGTAFALEVLDARGTVVRTLRNASRAAGVQRVWWDLGYEPPRPRGVAAGGFGGGGGGGGGFGGGGAPRALPGTYTVRLTVGDQRFEKPLEIRLDPTVQVARGDLEAQFELAVRLRDMQSLVNDTLRALDGRQAELTARKQAADAIPNGGGRAVSRQLAAEIAQVDSLIDALVKPSDIPTYSDGPKLANRIQQLLGNLGRGSHAPTGAQAEFSVELATEMRRLLDDARRILGRTTITM
jgi:photosystem II stability/assembly factor-like uncharacterized protein